MPELGQLTGSVRDWMLSEGWRILATIAIAVVVRWLLVRIINRVITTLTSKSAARLAETGLAGRAIAAATGIAHERYSQRMHTLGSLLRSVTTLVIFSVATLTVMALLGLPLGPVLASAGVGGVALGFGAQSLVRDFLSGVFMILEDQYGVGDIIDTGQVVGTVQEVSLRVTRLVDGSGVIWYVRNGEILRLGNRSQGWGLALLDVPVAYAEDAEKVIGVLTAALSTITEADDWREQLLSEPTVAGVESLDGARMTIRVTARTAPGQEAAVQRRLRERLKLALEEAGIEGPPLGPAQGPGTSRDGR